MGLRYPRGADKRKADRVPVSMNVEHADRDEAIGFGYARDISIEGLAVDAQALVDGKQAPATGTYLRMRFKLPKSNLVITAHGQVVRVDGEKEAPCIAVAFSKLDPDFKNEIAQYVRSTLRSL